MNANLCAVGSQAIGVRHRYFVRKLGKRMCPAFTRSDAVGYSPSNRRAITCAWISAAPSKMLRMRASHRTRLIWYSVA